ncbi:MAG: DUF4494 domain-containing protein [Porphyromonas sp.]|nr:DUF4494 domain-containing protein [Porphyromonas sp.]
MSWFECKVTYEKEVGNNGVFKKVSENYLVDAENFTEAEARLTKYLDGRGAFIMVSVKKVRLYELFLDHKSQRFYKAKVGFITLDEKNGCEKKKYVQMLVQADDLELALEGLHKGMKGTLSDYEIASIAETSIVEVVK